MNQQGRMHKKQIIERWYGNTSVLFNRTLCHAFAHHGLFAHCCDTLEDLLSISWIYVAVWYGLAVLSGYFALKRTRRTKDHEFRRSEIMKKMKHVYDAEAKGVWERTRKFKAIRI